MRLLTLSDVGFTYRHPMLLDGINLSIDSGERIGLLGRNGTGKSTLLKLIAGDIQPDHGDVKPAANLKIARLIQEVPDDIHGTIYEVVSSGYTNSANAQNTATGADEYDEHDWQLVRAVDRVLSRMQLDPDHNFATLSSGMKRRVLLAQALVGEPDILLLDEPTNHLDIDSITWLENFLKGFRATLVFITHDRVFLQALSTRILEIDRGRLFDWSCDYHTFLKRKADALEAEEKQNALFDKRLAQEEVWIRQGIKARRTRNEGRVRALEAMRNERSQRRNQIGNIRLQAGSADQSGLLVIEAKDVSFSYGDRTIIESFSTLITRGDKLGIIGPNGAGKSTLLKLLLKQLDPTTGTIRQGTRLEILYFDQLREQIDPEKSVADNVSDGKDFIDVDGVRRHIYGYLQDFLFTPDRSRQLAKFLSGGERNRLLLARLFKNPSNLLILDEPTNDLDQETLELLEEMVTNYKGTLLLVSHDRAFLNNVVTNVLVLEGNGVVKEYAGGYDDYLRQRNRGDESAAEVDASTTPAKPSGLTASKPPAKASKPVKLSFKEQREFEAIPAKIEALEAEQAAIAAKMADPTFFKKSASDIATATNRLDQVVKELAILFARWEEFEARS